MTFTSFAGQPDLFFAFAEALDLLFAQSVYTMPAAYAGIVIRALHFFDRYRHSARMTLFIVTGVQVAVYRYPVIKHETLALPQAVSGGNFFQVIQNAATKMIYVVKSLLFQIGRRFFATNTTGAEHGNLRAYLALQISFYEVRELSKRIRMRVNCVLKCADTDLVFVPGVNKQQVRIGKQFVPVLRIDVALRARC